MARLWVWPSGSLMTPMMHINSNVFDVNSEYDDMYTRVQQF